jgi:TetR/AcrR family transcriptional regulator
MYSTDKSGKQATEVRQAGLINAAIQLAAQRSPAAITTGDLALAVGITQGAVFRHFDSKQSLWLAVLRWVRHTLLQRLQDAADLNAGQPMAALRAVFLAHVEFVLAHPGVPRILFHELQQPEDSPHKAEVRALMQAYRALLMRLLASAKDLNLIAIDVDTESASVLFLGSIQGLVMQALMAGDVSAMRQQATAVYAIYQRGLQSAATDSTQGNP